MKTVILAEKPDQAKKYANALGTVNRGKGYFDVNTNIIAGDVVVTWGIGHLVGLASMDSYGDQYKKWQLSNLPFKPDKMLYEVTKSTKDQFINVKKQLEQADQIVIATDPDREGEHIAYSIFLKCSQKIKKIPKKRLWINSMVDSEIQRGFKSLKNSEETINYHIEAQTRQISDYLIGMNFTQFFTLLTQSKGLTGVYSLGRVQTPCNSLVVQNDIAIKEFKEEIFYKLFGTITKDNQLVKFTNDIKYSTKEELLAVLNKNKLDNPLKTSIVSVVKEIKEKKSPKLFNLGGIQSYANKKWKYSLDNSLKIIQSLYQEGFLSYPRTDCDLITTNEFEYLRGNLDRYKQLLGVNFENKNLEPRKEFVNNAKVLEHYAVIPTVKIPNLNNLEESQRNIYEAVVRNTILMFADNYVYESTAVKLKINDLTFTAKGNVPKILGWTKIESIDRTKEKDSNDITLPNFTEGETVIFSPQTEKGKTTPPSRLTEASLGGKGGMMDKLGLGTPATRSSIIKTLIDRQYMTVDKTKLYPTEKGLLLYDLTKDILLGSPEMTAKWEIYLKKIGEGSGTQEVFLKNIKTFIEKTLIKLKEQGIKSELVTQVVNSNSIEIGNYIVKEENKVYKCTEKSNPQTQFIIFKNISGKNITLTTVKQLLVKGKTSLIKGFISTKNKGSKYDAYLILKDQKVKLEFPKRK